MNPTPSSGSLVVVGVGLKLVGQVTLEAQAFIQQAEKVLYLVANDSVAHWIQTLNATAESLNSFYAPDKLRALTYREIADHILDHVRQGLQVCVAIDGHPGLLVTSAHAAIRQARREGFRAWLTPGISTEACLFADLGFDPGRRGWQNFEATNFLLYRRQVDITCHVILWQLGAVGMLYGAGDISTGLRVLTEVLVEVYGPEHEVVIYEASPYPMLEPVIERIALGRLPAARVTPIATLYIPPKARAELDPAMLKRLGIDVSQILGQESVEVS